MPVLLSPHRLLTDYIILESLHIIKNNKQINLETKPLDGTELKKYYSDLPREARDILCWFNKEGLQFTKEEIKKVYSTRNPEQDFETFAEGAILRRLHELITKLKPFTSLLKWYHKKKIDQSNFKTSPCTFSAFRPNLAFEVIKKNGELCVQTQIVINGISYHEDNFTKHHFLLESRNEYFLLSFKDYQTLEWIIDNDPAQYGSRPQELASNILVVLEANYPVNRNNLFDTHQVNVLPLRRVMLSEISNSFLVLTPQWIYEGFLQEYPYKTAVELVRNGKVCTINRNKNEEETFLRMLEALHPNFSKQLNGYFYLSFADAQKKQWFLKVYHHLLEQDIELVGMDMLQHFRYSQYKVRTTTKVAVEKNDFLTLQFDTFFGEEEVPLQNLQKTLLAGQRAVLLKDGSLGILSDEWLRQYGMLVRHGKVVKKQLLVGRWLAITEPAGDGQEQVLNSVIKEEWWKKWRQWQHLDEPLYSLPKGVRVNTLRTYQQKGYEWMRLLAEVGGSVCLADDMGLGKTLQAICFLVGRIEAQPDARHLVVCPTSLIYNWQEELQKFAPAVKSLAYHGPNRNAENLTAKETQIVIASYGVLRSDISIMCNIPFDTLVVDESHNIKNPAALITQAVNQVQSGTRIALSGTPVMNNTFDLYSQLSFLLPGMFSSKEFFKREYADPIDRNRDEEKIKALQKLTAPFILRRTKEQVATDLPEKTENILWCEMGTDQKFAYESIKENIRGSIFLEIKDKGFNAGKLSVLHGIMKLRQVCNSCELVENEDLFSYESVKTQLLIEELKNIIENHKALVFSQFTKMLDLLERDLSKQQIQYCRLDGNTKPSKRQDLVNNFNRKDSREKVFLISLKAGNAGLNLTAADYVFLFDPWWNTAVEQQAIDRTHRIGQTRNVFAYKMVCRNTIEEKIIQLQQRKNKLSKDLIGGEEGFVKTLTEEDVAFLFG